MKSKKIILALLVFGVALLLTACGHTHTFSEDWSKDATHHWHSANCEHTTEVSEKAEHTWDEGVQTKAPTEEEKGTKLFTCTVCSATKEEEIEKLPHTHKYQDTWTSDATHHWHAASCEHTTEVSDKAEHTWDEGVVTLEPTEEAVGKKLHTCTVCEATKEAEIEKLPHTHRYLDTWTSDEEYHWHGSACGHEDEVKDLAEHGWDEGSVTKLPTCEANGEKTFTCTTCQATKVEPVSKDMNAHSFEETWTHDETHHWHAAACSHDVVDGKAEHVWDEGKVTTEPTYHEEGVKTFTCECGRTRTESIPVLKNYSDENWTSLVEQGYYYLDGAVISNVSEDLKDWFNADQTNFNLYNTQVGKNYTINVDVKGVSNTEKHPTLIAGVVAWYQDANNYIIFGAHWAEGDRPHEIRSFWFKGLVGGEWYSTGDWWCDNSFILPADGMSISVSKSGNVFTFEAKNLATGKVIKSGNQTIPGTNTVSSKVGVYGVNEPFSFTNFAAANIEAAPAVYTATIAGAKHTLSLSMMTDEFTLVQGDATITGTYTENGRNKTLTYADGTVQVVRTTSKGKAFEYITLKSMEDPDMTVTNKPVALIEEATGDYVVSFDFLGSLAYEGTSAKLMIQAWYLDENNYVTIYLEWGAQDRPHEVKCIQITGYLNGQHIGWNDGWTDNSKYLPIDGGSFKVEKIGQKFVATYTNDSGYSKVHERTINIDTTKAYSVLAQAEGDTFKLDNYSFKEVKPTNNVTYKSEDQKSSLTIDKNSNNCILNVNGEEQAGFYTLDGSYGIVTIGETQRHFKLVVDKSLLILYTPAQAEEDPKAVTVTPEASVELAKEVEGDIELVMDVKGLIKSNVTADRTNFNLYPWYLDENNYVIAKVEWWGGDRPYEVRSIILEAYINGAKVAGTERFGDWPSTYTLPADGFKLTVTKTGNKFVFKFVSALTGVEKVTDTVTVNGLDTAASYSVVAASVTDTFTVSNVAGLPEALDIISIAEALQIGNTYAKDTYSTEKYTIVGTVKEVQNTTYGNILLTDGTNDILVYGLYSEDGKTRYDKLANKPGLGDVITVTGVLGKYSAAQMKNGWLLAIEEHVCSEYKDATCKVPASCVVCGAHKDDVLSNVHDYKDGVCTVCNGVDPDYEGEVVQLVTATLSFANKANRTTFTTSQQVWEQNGIKLINDKGSSTSNVADYANPARFYKSSKITVECANMTKIVFTCNSSSYATALKNSISGANVTISGSLVTITFDAPVNSFVISSLTGGQVRINSMEVTYQK